MRLPDRTEALLTLFQEGNLAQLHQMAQAHGYAKTIAQARHRYRRSSGARRQSLRYLLRELLLAAEATADWPAREALSAGARAERDHLVRADFRCALADTYSRRIRPLLAQAPGFIGSRLLLFAGGWLLTPVVEIADRLRWLRQDELRGDLYWQRDDRSW